MRPLILISIAAVILAYLFVFRRPSTTQNTANDFAQTTGTPTPRNSKLKSPVARPKSSDRGIAPPTHPQEPSTSLKTASAPGLKSPSSAASNEESKTLALPYVMEDGVAIVMGDIVVGAPTREGAPETGMAEIPPIALWPNQTVAYHIQPSLPQPERVREALALFDGTSVHFVPYTTQEDALVFEPGTGICKSYVGKIGGKQPLWLAPNCGPVEIAHEILHALGFIHEQNRLDRDDFIQVHFENIDEPYKFNFEKLPKEFMKVSGQGPFDFESIMIYPPWMFARSGQSTMEPKIKDQQIQPSTHLSKTDIERLARIYGER